jgi:hypothetical protein
MLTQSSSSFQIDVHQEYFVSHVFGMSEIARKGLASRQETFFWFLLASSPSSSMPNSQYPVGGGGKDARTVVYCVSQASALCSWSLVLVLVLILVLVPVLVLVLVMSVVTMGLWMSEDPG